MNPCVLLDTGPLVALLNQKDSNHVWVVDQLSDISPPLLTCEAVIVEACFLLRQLFEGYRKVLELIMRDFLALPFRIEQEAKNVEKLMTRFQNLPMSYADACLVRMTEQYAGAVVLTLDRGFRIYRRHGRQVIPVIMPGNF